MSSSSLSFNDDAFRRFADEAVATLAAQQTADLDQLREQYAGQPLEQIRSALQELFARYDGNITEPNLSAWAQLIQDNTRIEMKPEPIDWSAS